MEVGGLISSKLDLSGAFWSLLTRRAADTAGVVSGPGPRTREEVIRNRTYHPRRSS
jgi:hypothetical protein